MRVALRHVALIGSLVVSLVACDMDGDDGDEGPGAGAKPAPQSVGPGADATDTRAPELPDLSIMKNAKVTMSEGLAAAQAKGVNIEAKFELDHSNVLSLSLYPAGKGLLTDAERNLFQEMAGDATHAPFQGKVEVFEDRDHLVRSARDLTLVQLSKVSLADAVSRASKDGIVYWAIPTIRETRAGYGVYVLGADRKTHYFFVS